MPNDLWLCNEGPYYYYMTTCLRKTYAGGGEGKVLVSKLLLEMNLDLEIAFVLRFQLPHQAWVEQENKETSDSPWRLGLFLFTL